MSRRWQTDRSWVGMSGLVAAIILCTGIAGAQVLVPLDEGGGGQKPSITGVSVTPDPAFYTSTLNAIPEGWYDPQGDPEGYQFQWAKWDGLRWINIEGATDATLEPGNFTRNDQLLVTCQPYDGAFLGNPVTDTVTISDAAPTCVITSPTDDATLLHNPVSVQGTAADDGTVTKVLVRFNGGIWLVVSGTSIWSRQINVPLGATTIEARAQDEVGHWGPTTSVTIRREIDPPSVTITSPEDGFATSSYNVLVSGSAADNVSVSLVRVRVNGGAWANANGTDDWWRWLPLSMGPNIIEARAKDNHDLWGPIQQITVNRVGNTAPTVTITSPADGFTTSDKSVTVMGIAHDDKGVSAVRIRINGVVWLNATGTTSWQRVAPLALGANVIEARARDNEGLWGPIVQITVNRD